MGPEEGVDPRRAQIVGAATEVFLRFGFKKTSMDDLARAAGLSRQGLYLHFSSKEALFSAAVTALVDSLDAAYRAAFAHPRRDAAGRIVGGFEALHGPAIGRANQAEMAELMATAEALVGPLTAQLEARFLTDLAALIAREGLVARARDPELGARALAEHLDAVSCGLKHQRVSLAGYRERMRRALRVVFGL